LIHGISTLRPIEVTDRPNARKSRLLKAGAGCREPIVITTGANLRRAHATAMMMHGHSDVVLATIAKNQIKTGETAMMILAGPTAIATVARAIARSRMHSPDKCTSLADRSASSFTTAIANTPCAAPNRGRSRPLVHSEWSPAVISETTMGVRLIPGLVTCDTCVNKG
jgi:hypothetical protein